MIILLVNNNYILPLNKEEYDKNPIKAFDLFYSSTGLYLYAHFSEWLNSFIINDKATESHSDSVKNKISTTLSNPKKLKRAAIKLFPIQVDVIENNWDAIKNTLDHITYNKRLYHPTFGEFAAFEAYIEEKINKVLHV